MAIKLKIDREGLYTIGQALQVERYNWESIPYLDLEEVRVVALEEAKLPMQLGIRPRYVEIPCISHAALHRLLDHFVQSLEQDDARKAVEGKLGIGETLDTLDKYMDAHWEFPVFAARTWLASVGIQVTD
jgi:hypothetical protein